MKKISLLSFLPLILMGIPGPGCREKAAEAPPNIIFLLADDQRADAFGFMGNESVITPHLDKLASDGVVFENAYHAVPICQPSRASIMTGQYLGTHGAGFNKPANYVITGKEFDNSYPALLRRSGYFTGFIGKFGFAVGKDGKIRNTGLEAKEEYMPAGYFDVWNGFPGQGSYLPTQGKFNGYPDKSRAGHLTGFIGDQAIDFLRTAQKADKPFCLSVSFKAPHAPFIPAERFRKMYEGKLVPRMVNDAPEYYRLLPAVVKEKSRNTGWYFGRSKGYYGEDTGYRRDWHIELDSTYQEFIKNYYALITGIDDVVGRIREELKQTGADRNTVIVYTSDNGFFAGSRQMMGKELLYDESVKAPLIVYDPRTPAREREKRKKALISTIDIAPSLLDMAGVEAPENYPGKSFLPLVRGTGDSIHETVYGENNFDNFYPLQSEVRDPEHYQSIRCRYVRTLRYKYIRYHENHPVTEELYAVDRDPLETENLIGDPAYAGIREELRAKLDNFEKVYVRYGRRSSEPARKSSMAVQFSTDIGLSKKVLQNKGRIGN